MKTKKPWKKPEGYNCPFFTTTVVAEILGLNFLTLSNKKEKFATEVTPGNYLWSKVDIEEYSQNCDGRGLKNIYEYNPNWKKKHLNEA